MQDDEVSSDLLLLGNRPAATPRQLCEAGADGEEHRWIQWIQWMPCFANGSNGFWLTAQRAQTTGLADVTRGLCFHEV